MTPSFSSGFIPIASGSGDDRAGLIGSWMPEKSALLKPNLYRFWGIAELPVRAPGAKLKLRIYRYLVPSAGHRSLAYSDATHNRKRFRRRLGDSSGASNSLNGGLVLSRGTPAGRRCGCRPAGASTSLASFQIYRGAIT